MGEVVKLKTNVTPIASFRATYGSVMYDYDFRTEQEKSHITHLQRTILTEFYMKPVCLGLYLRDNYRYTLHEAQEILMAFDIGEVIFVLASKRSDEHLQYIDYLKNEQS